MRPEWRCWRGSTLMCWPERMDNKPVWARIRLLSLFDILAANRCPELFTDEM